MRNLEMKFSINSIKETKMIKKKLETVHKEFSTKKFFQAKANHRNLKIQKNL